jgi:C-terminal processing protease CtpA/Prc
VYVDHVIPNGAAKEAGVKPKDVITIDGIETVTLVKTTRNCDAKTSRTKKSKILLIRMVKKKGTHRDTQKNRKR